MTTKIKEQVLENTIAALTGREAEYIKRKQKPGKHYHSLILDYLENFESASREKINELLIDEIRGDYSREQKLTKIGNILSYMRRKGLMVNLSTDHSPIWVLFKTYEKLRDNKEKNHSAKTEEVCP